MFGGVWQQYARLIPTSGSSWFSRQFIIQSQARPCVYLGLTKHLLRWSCLGSDKFQSGYPTNSAVNQPLYEYICVCVYGGGGGADAEIARLHCI